MTTTQTDSVRRPTTSSVVVGVIVLLLIAAAGGALAVLQPAKWTATASFVVLPQAGLDAADSASYYETLSRGQVAATFAEIAANSSARQQALDALAPTVASEVTSEITVVPNTSVILITVTAPQAAVAETVADTISTGAIADLASVSAPYALNPVADASGSAYASGTSPVVVLTVAVVVGVVAAILVQQIVYQLVLAVRRRRVGRATPAPAAPATASGDPILAGGA